MSKRSKLIRPAQKIRLTRKKVPSNSSPRRRVLLPKKAMMRTMVARRREVNQSLSPVAKRLRCRRSKTSMPIKMRRKEKLDSSSWEPRKPKGSSRP